MPAQHQLLIAISQLQVPALTQVLLPWPLRLLLQHCCRPHNICSTWYWGSLTARNKQYDPLADLYSLSFTFLEVRLMAGGACFGWRAGRQAGRLPVSCPADWSGAGAACLQVWLTSEGAPVPLKEVVDCMRMKNMWVVLA